MTKQYTFVLAILSLSVLLICCGRNQPPMTSPQTVNLLVATSGTVRLKRDGWKDFVPVAAGARLQPTDLLEVQGSATVLCDGPMVMTMTALGKTPCPLERGSFVYDGARVSSGQRGIPKDIPYIVFPRNTLVLKNRPLLMWNDTGAPPYTVTIVDNTGKEVLPQIAVTDTRLAYPTDAPTLQPGIDYLLVVRDAKGKTSVDDPAKGLGFRVLSATSRPDVEQQSAAILALEGLDETARQLALAVSYATWPGEDGRGLYVEAWQVLEQVAQTHDTPPIRLWIGDMLHAMRLPNEAEIAYQHALQQAKASGDRASQAAAEAGLWRVTSETTRLDAALVLYDHLGDMHEVTALRTESTP
jgi:hypothetical protein